MTRQAHNDGISAICATPHVRADHDVRIAELPERLERLRAELLAAGLETAILPGAEVAADRIPDLDRADLKALTLGGGGRWILLEPSPGPLDERLEDAIETLDRHGLRALIAHPERHGTPDLTQRLRRLTKRGALIQATAAFLVDQDTRAAMLELAGAGVVHVLGSDAHSSLGGRRVELRGAIRALAGVPTVSPHLDWVAEIAPRAIVDGAELTPPFGATAAAGS